MECTREEREIGGRRQRERGKEKMKDREGNIESETEEDREIREWKRKIQNIK